VWNSSIGNKESLVLVHPNVNEMCEIHPFIHSLSGDKESLVFSTPKCERKVSIFSETCRIKRRRRRETT
jgi:hypothetical protein